MAAQEGRSQARYAVPGTTPAHGGEEPQPRWPARRGAFDARVLASALGWFSIAAGLAGVLAPRMTAGLIGVRPSRTSARALRAVGLRELASGAGILARARPVGWLWARAAGDAVDLALLGSALTSRRARRGRLLAAGAAVAGIGALDVLAGRRLARETDGAGAVRVQRSITIDRPREELYRLWRDVGNLPRFMRGVDAVQPTGERRSHWRVRGPGGATLEWDAEITDDRPGERIAWRTLPGAAVEHTGVVRFERAPGGRGTEVHVGLDYRAPGGALGATVARLLGHAPEQRAAENLRRLKQLVEAGEIPVSEGVALGVARPAQGGVR